MGSVKKAMTQTEAPSVAPIIGMSPSSPTVTASTAAYGMPTTVIMTQDSTPLIVATETCPSA